MAGEQTADLMYRAALDAMQFNAGLQTMEAGLNRLKSLTMRIAAAAGIGLTFREMFHSFKGALEAGDHLHNLSVRTGESVKNLMIWEEAAKNAGLGAHALGMMINQMQFRLEAGSRGGRGSSALEKLKLSAEELKKMRPTEQLEAIGEAMKNVASQTERVKIARDLFGRMGPQMMGLLVGNEVGDAAKILGNQVNLMATSAAAFNETKKLLGMLPVKLHGFWIGFASEAVKTIYPLLDKLKGMDFSQWGEKIARVFNYGMAAISKGNFGEYLTTGFHLAILKIHAPLMSAMNMAVNVFTAGIIGAAQAMLNLLETAADGIMARIDSYTHGEEIDRAEKIISQDENKQSLVNSLMRGEGLFTGLQELQGKYSSRSEQEIQASAQTGVPSNPSAALADALKSVAVTSHALEGFGKKIGVGSFEEYAKRERDKVDKQREADRGKAGFNEADYKTPSLETLAKRFTDNFVSYLQELANAGISGLIAKPSTEAIANTIASNTNKLFQSLADAAKNAPPGKPANQEDIDRVQQQWDELTKEYKKIITEWAEGVPTTETPGKPTPGEPEGGIPNIEADQLSKIGLFIGGTGPVADYQRQTADNTAEIAETSREMLEATVGVEEAIMQWAAGGDINAS